MFMGPRDGQAGVNMVTAATKHVNHAHHATAELSVPVRGAPAATHLSGGPRLRAARCAQIRRAGMPLDEANYAHLIHQASQPGHLGFAVQVRHAFSAVVLPWQAPRGVPAAMRCLASQCSAGAHVQHMFGQRKAVRQSPQVGVSDGSCGGAAAGRDEGARPGHHLSCVHGAHLACTC